MYSQKLLWIFFFGKGGGGSGVRKAHHVSAGRTLFSLRTMKLRHLCFSRTIRRYCAKLLPAIFNVSNFYDKTLDFC